MKSLPEGVKPYQRTKDFTEETVPAGLTSSHRTKAGVWGRICVEEGELLYRILEPAVAEHRLGCGLDGVIEPEVSHEVVPLGAVRFYVEFLRLPRGDDPGC